MKVIIGAPDVSFLIVLSAALIGWFVSRYHYKKRLEDTDKRLELRDDQIQSLRADNEKLEANNEKLQAQLKSQTLVAASSTFSIEQRRWKVLWRKKGDTEYYHPLRPDLPVPDDATLVFMAVVRINADPARVVENIVLYIAGNRIHLLDGSWQSRLVDHCEQNLYFDIPVYIDLAYHKVQLIAECAGGVEERSPVFRVPLTRTYIEGL